MLEGQDVMGRKPNGVVPLGGFSIQFPLQHPNAALPQTVFAAPTGLQMFFRSDADQLYGMESATNFNGRFVAFVHNHAVVVVGSEAGLCSLEEGFLADGASHACNTRD